jgi:hypothetical protein
LAFFGGGLTNGNQPSNVVDIFNSTSQTWSTSTLSQARYALAASSIGEIVAFGGGWNGLKVSSVVDMLNVTSNTWFTLTFSQPRYFLASTSSTNKIFFGGGYSSSEYSNVVDIFCFGGNCLLPHSHYSSCMFFFWIFFSEIFIVFENPQYLILIYFTAVVISIVVGAVCTFIGILVIVLLGVCLWYRKKRMKEDHKTITLNYPVATVS